MSFELICSSVQGASHLKHGTPREDYGIAEQIDDLLVFVTADGHGDSNCPRSDLGSGMACESAYRMLLSFARSITEEDLGSELFRSRTQKLRIRQLMLTITADWKESVLAHLSEHPLTEQERLGCENYIDQYDRGERLEHIYGTTLIAGIATPLWILLLQQGDGRCVVFDENGNAAQPIPWDENCFQNVTTSMCDEDAGEEMRYCVLDPREIHISAILACSDGIEDSFYDMDQMHAYCRRLLLQAGEHSAETLNASLPEELSALSAVGSGDDMTITGIVDPVLVRNNAEAFRLASAEVEKRARIRKLHDRLNSMEGKLNYLRELAETEQSSPPIPAEPITPDEEPETTPEPAETPESDEPVSHAKKSVFADLFSRIRNRAEARFPEQPEVHPDPAESDPDPDEPVTALEQYLNYKAEYDRLSSELAALEAGGNTPEE